VSDHVLLYIIAGCNVLMTLLLIKITLDVENIETKTPER
jgi:hypothetical protein